MYEWDEAKNKSNKAKHDYSFEQMEFFNWDFAIEVDSQVVGQPPETRELIVGLLKLTLVAVVITERDNGTRIISLRGATRRERNLWIGEFYGK